jgi:putative AdoMet-dependent methyltransferase
VICPNVKIAKVHLFTPKGARVMTPPPKWQLDEMKHLTMEYIDPAEVQTFDVRRQGVKEEERHEAIIRCLHLGRSQTVLDMGTGTGAFALVAARYCAKVYAVDLSPAMLDCARQKTAAAGVTNIEFHQGGCLTYEHQADPVDAIVVKFVLHQLPDFWKMVALRRMYQMLKPGGKLYVYDLAFSFPIDEYAKQFNDWIAWWLDIAGPDMVPNAERHLREKHTTFAWIMEGLLTRAGFTLDKADYEEDWLAEYICTKPPHNDK